MMGMRMFYYYHYEIKIDNMYTTKQCKTRKDIKKTDVKEFIKKGNLSTRLKYSRNDLVHCSTTITVARLIKEKTV